MFPFFECASPHKGTASLLALLLDFTCWRVRVCNLGSTYWSTRSAANWTQAAGLIRRNGALAARSTFDLARMDLVVDFADAYAFDAVYSKVSPNWLGADSFDITRQFLSLYLIVVSGGHVPALHTPPGQNTIECTTRGAAYT